MNTSEEIAARKWALEAEIDIMDMRLTESDLSFEDAFATRAALDILKDRIMELDHDTEETRKRLDVQ